MNVDRFRRRQARAPRVNRLHQPIPVQSLSPNGSHNDLSFSASLTGCTKVSPGCAHCYAEAITLRFKRGGPFLPGKTTIRLHPDRLDDPGKWRSPRRVFVNSMSDLFHEEVPFEFIREVFARMEAYPAHTYQILTKRPERMLDYVRTTGNAKNHLVVTV